jgi:hypothetical protein
MTNGSATRDAGIALPVTSLAAVDGPGAACLGNGMFGPPFYYNRAALYSALAVSGWFYDPVAPHCYPASFDGRLGEVAPPPRDPICPGNGTQPGTDASDSTRSPTFPAGLAGTTEASCCEACAGDANCVAWVWSDGSDPDPTGNCWPLASYDGTNQHKGRIFSPIPPTPAAQAWWAMGLAADFYLAPAADALAYNTAYYQLTGIAEMPPLFAFGLTATYWGYDTMLEVEGNMTAFRDGRFPVSTFVLDYDCLFAHFQNDINMRWGGIRKPRSYSNIPFNSLDARWASSFASSSSAPVRWSRRLRVRRRTTRSTALPRRRFRFARPRRRRRSFARPPRRDRRLPSWPRLGRPLPPAPRLRPQSRLPLRVGPSSPRPRRTSPFSPTLPPLSSPSRLPTPPSSTLGPSPSPSAA